MFAVKNINLTLESLSIKKKPHQKPLHSFKGLRLRDRKSDFVLYYVMIGGGAMFTFQKYLNKRCIFLRETSVPNGCL